MKILFVASVAIVTPDPPESRKLFIDALGLPLKRHEGDEYYFSESIEGSKHFGVWPLSQAAQACFGTTVWPPDRPVPHACFEFEVADEAGSAAPDFFTENTSLQLLQRTRTPRSPTFSSATRKRVWQLGHWTTTLPFSQRESDRDKESADAENPLRRSLTHTSTCGGIPVRRFASQAPFGASR